MYFRLILPASVRHLQGTSLSLFHVSLFQPALKSIGQCFLEGTKFSTFSKMLQNTAPSIAVDHLDPFQVSLMKEKCIVVDENDAVVRADTKENCHLMENIKKGLLHRAFSVFLFNTKGELLLQQRSDTKITYPGYFSNTCCSHPLFTDKELEETDAIGVKRAAQRRLFQELGIKPDQAALDAFQYITRIHYKAPYNEIWGEHEIDYILFIQKDVDLVANPHEVKRHCYIGRHQMKEFVESLDAPVTPWFKLIMNSFLFEWWDNLTDLDKLKNHKTIHRMS